MVVVERLGLVGVEIRGNSKECDQYGKARYESCELVFCLSFLS